MAKMADSSSNDDADMNIPMKTLTEIQQRKVNIWNIEPRDFNRALNCYSETVFNQVLDLDHQRFETIPKRLREQSSSIPLGLQSAELNTLSHWTYKRCDESRKTECRNDFKEINSRNLLSDHVQRVTSTAFEEYERGHLLDAVATLKKGLPTACFETATLVLSVAYPDTLPFFSPDLVRYCEKAPHEDGRVSQDDTDGKKYEAIVCLVEQTRTRIKRNTKTMAHDVEKVAHVLRLLDTFRDTYANPLAVGKRTDLNDASDSNSTVQQAPLVPTQEPRSGLPSDTAFVVKLVSALSSKKYRILDYLQEIKISQNLSSQQDIFVKLYAWSYYEGHIMIMMELMVSDLDKYLKDGRTWKQVENCSVKEPFCQLLSGINAMHSVGMTHRDIKPQNIFIDKAKNKLKIGDFGVSKHARNSDYTTMITGRSSRGYTAPEILKASERDAKSVSYNNKVDMWSLGCVLFRMIHGRNLFSSNEKVKKLHCVALYIERKSFKDLMPGLLKTEQSRLLWQLVCLDDKKRLKASEALKICQNWSEE